MILDVKDGVRGVLVNAETGQRIAAAFWANTDTGDYKAWVTGPDGRVQSPPGVVVGKCPLRFVPSGAAVTPPKPTPPACNDVRPACNDVRPPRTGGVRVPAVPGWECEERYCHRPGIWQTADEQEAEPGVQADGKLCQRAVTAALHRWCERHYRFPTFVSLRGVESEVEVKARPQW